ncbi:MAG: aromatic acid exporter family protein [Lachnospiraceae bacterium]|nr:aromatic acid exporter family protein [Lachnospiraceae bacterium]
MVLERLKDNWKQWFVYAARLALASSLAIYAADLFKLQFATQAGVICLFSMLSTSKETLRLSVKRILSFAVTFVAAWIAFHHISSEWVAFGVFIFVTVVFSEMFGWGAALSMNVVAGCHFLSVDVFTTDIIINELYIVLTGMTFAIIFNLVRDTTGTKATLEKNIEEVQGKMQAILDEMADYLDSQGGDREVWQMLDDLQSYLETCIMNASEYEGNSFENDAKYYVRYFQMRRSQSMILINLHEELQKIKYVPKQSQIINEYIHYLSAFVTEMNVPEEQINNLRKIFEKMEEEDLPVTREEFESRAVLFHVLMDLDDFLRVKQRFIESGDAKHIRFLDGSR